jgi:nitrite reductase/ring-hydroxylating ferredoxin subunit
MHNAEISFADVAEGSSVCIELQGIKVLVLRSEGRVFAYEDRCPHAFWPLSQGTLAGSVLECPGHGWEFDVQSGRCLTSPSYCLKPVAFEIVGEKIVLQREEANATINCGEANAPACS